MQDREVKHYKDMNREELIELVGTMSWMALNLAQHLNFTEGLKVQYRKQCYERAIKMAWEICYAWKYEYPEGDFEISYFGSNGLEVTTGDVSELVEGGIAVGSERDIEFDYNNFEHLYVFLDEGIPTEEDIKEQEKRLKYLRDLTNDKFNREHVDVKVKTLNKALWSIEYITEFAKVSRAMLNFIKNDVK